MTYVRINFKTISVNFVPGSLSCVAGMCWCQLPGLVHSVAGTAGPIPFRPQPSSTQLSQIQQQRTAGRPRQRRAGHGAEQAERDADQHDGATLHQQLPASRRRVSAATDRAQHQRYHHHGDHTRTLGPLV